MKAAVLNKKNEDLEIKDVPMPEIDEDDVLVPFYRFYDALADTLDPSINSVIIKEKKNEH